MTATSPLILGGIALFFAVQFGVSALAIGLGGAPERIVGATLLFAAVATTLASWVFPYSFARVWWLSVWIDAVLLAILLAVTAIADRFWPIWLTAFQVLALFNHALRAYDPGLIYYAYWFIAGKMAYPMLLILLLGTLRHRGRSREHRGEADWTFQRRRAGKP